MKTLRAMGYVAFAAALSQLPGSRHKRSPPRAGGLKVGQPMPDFKMTDTTGKEHTLADYKGTVVVFNFCTQECPYSRRGAPISTPWPKPTPKKASCSSASIPTKTWNPPKSPPI